MPEINLLPDDLRGKEQKEIKSAQKNPKIIKVEMSSPQKDKVTQPLSTARPSLISRLFAKKVKKAAALPPEPEKVIAKPEESNRVRKEKKVFHIPKINFKAEKKASDIAVSRSSLDKIDAAPAGSVQQRQDTRYDTSIATGAKEELAAQIQRGQGAPEKSKEVKKKKSFGESIQTPKKRKKKFSSGFFSSPKANKVEDSMAATGSENQSKSNGDEAYQPEKSKEVKKKKSFGKDDKSVLELNLIPEELSKYQEVEMPRLLFINGLIIFLSVLVIIVAFLAITWYQINITKQIDDLKVVIENIDTEISKQNSQAIKAEDLQDRLQVIQVLIDGHVYWTEFFKLLEENTLPGVFFSNFAMTGTESIVLFASARDYSTVAKQIIVLEEADHFIADVSVSAASANIDSVEGSFNGVDFNVELKFQPGVFLKVN